MFLALVFHIYMKVEGYLLTYSEAMSSQDLDFGRKMDSIIGYNTSVLEDLPPGCKPIGCK